MSDVHRQEGASADGRDQTCDPCKVTGQKLGTTLTLLVRVLNFDTPLHKCMVHSVPELLGEMLQILMNYRT